MAKKSNASTASRKNYYPNKKDFYPELNFALLEKEYSAFKNSTFIILPIPYDAVTSFKPGAREGPGAVIDSSQFLELYDQELKKEIYKAGIHTLPDIIPAPGDPQTLVDRIYRVANDLVNHKKVVVGLGGDHSVSLGLVKAHLKHFPGLSVLQFDAHPDLRDTYEGTPYSSATVMRRSVEIGAKVVQVGLRALSQEDVLFAKKAGVVQFFAEDIVGRDDWIEGLIDNLKDQVYVSFDVDFLDPSIMSATGTPEPGGLDWYQTLKILREIARKRHIVGFDVVELSPSLGPHSCSFLAAKLVYKIMGYISEGKK